MSQDYRNLSSTEITPSKAILFTIYFLLLLLPISWITKNITDTAVSQSAFWYWVLLLTTGTTFCIATLFSLGASIRKTANSWKIRFIDFCIYEEETAIFGKLPKNYRFLINVIVPTFVFILFFTIVSLRKEALLGTATLQLVDLGPFAGILSTVLFALVEGGFFVCFWPPTIYAITYRITKNVHIASAVTLIVAPLTFTVYHYGRYGTADIGASFWVFIINFTSVLWLLTIRNALFEFAMHTGNNLSKVIGTTYGLPVEFIILIFIIVIVIEIFFYLVSLGILNSKQILTG